MCTLDGGDDAFEFGEFESRSHSLRVGDCKHLGATNFGEMGVHWTYAGIIETRRNAVRLGNLTVLIHHHERATAVQDAFATEVNGCRRFFWVFKSKTGCFCGIEAHFFILNVMVERASRIAAAADASEEMVGIVATGLLLELLLDFLADDALKPCHHVGVRVGTNH